MRFVVDAQLPPALARWLVSRGHVAAHVAEPGLLAAADAMIADHVACLDAILVSKDEDFVLLRLPDRFALLWLRVGNATNRSLLTWLERAGPPLSDCSMQASGWSRCASTPASSA